MPGRDYSEDAVSIATLQTKVNNIEADVADIKNDLREVRDALLKISGGNRAMWGLIGLIVAATTVIGAAWAFISRSGKT